MAASSIKIDQDTKQALDLLQAELTQALGRKVTQQELTRILVEEAQRHRERILAIFEERGEGIAPDAFTRWVERHQFDGPATDASGDLDALIYGDPHTAGPLRRRRKRR